MKRILLVIVTALAVSSIANAGFMIEPFLGYAVSGEVDDGTSKDDMTGFEYGARLGMTFAEMFAVGGEYAKGNYDIDSIPSDSIDTTDLGIFVSIEFPILVRLYATYLIDSQGETKDGTDVEGDGMRIGLGYTGLPFVNINLERVTRNYDKAGSFNIDVEATTTQIGLSVPLP